eukprot:CAMPEP_0172187904 /NCGR_PEP_ID=MMETSP1050-20130122/21607_1 /TAXON_ID=233186 /ORGANISM="Cryptomonas curvata, Strain CCAP979/52" /LENGTH=243 /DNA_ID=CAMNT_0012862299 /DNA_START=80 /DNA_END=807 /DNA_ORIENTATION=-
MNNWSRGLYLWAIRVWISWILAYSCPGHCDELIFKDVTTVAGAYWNWESDAIDGPAMSAFFLTPWAAAFHPNGTLLAIAEAGGNRIRLLDLRLGQTATLAGSGVRGFADGIATSAAFRGPRGTAFNPNGATVAVADTDNHRIRLIDLASGTTRTLSGAGDSGYADGAASDAQFFAPAALVFAPDGAAIFVADTAAHRIRRVDATTGAATTVAGSLVGQPGRADGPASSALFSSPGGLAVAPGG